MNDKNFEKIIALIEKKIGKSSFVFKEDTKLEEDLGLTGDDAIEFLTDYSEIFNVNVSKFEFMKYFGDEGDTTVSIFNHLFGRKTKEKKSLTIRDLELGINAGKLDDTIIR